MTIEAKDKVKCGGCGREIGSGETVVRDAQGKSFCEGCSGSDATVTMAAGGRGAAGGSASGTVMPDMIGRYKVMRLIGEGGMGAVYEAMQDSPKRVVALKVIRPGLMDQKRLRRFVFEAEVLGRLQHPAIAAIFDAGTADTVTGTQPYFAMEFIAGEKLTHYAKEQKLSTRARLELMATLADAVHYAHTKGVIHRDLKPANILVTGPVSGSASGGPQPKILDFGLARSTELDVHASMQTESGAVMGTLAYMAPEQAAGKPDQVDTRADVYALGVIAYELLCGELPLKLAGAGIYEAVRVIEESEPAHLSVHDRSLRGDVEVIVAKAMEKDKERRYSSAAAMASDIRRYLNNEAITARPASAMYQLGKFARRHKAVVGAIVGVAAALVLGMVGTSVGMMRARESQHVAEEATLRANAIARGAQIRWYEATVARGDALVSAGRIDEARKAYGEAWLGCNKLPVSAMPLELGLWECDRREKGTGLRTLKAEGGVARVWFSTDGARVSATGANGSTSMWDAATGESRAEPQTDADRHGPTQAVSLNGEEFRVKAADGKERGFAGHKGKVQAVAVSADGKLVVSGGEDKTVRLWEVATGKLVHTFEGHERAVTAIDLANGKIVSGDEGGVVMLWDFSSTKDH